MSCAARRPTSAVAIIGTGLSRGCRNESQGMKDPIPRIQMLDGFNEGWIDFENREAGAVKGATTLEAVMRRLVEIADQTPRDEVA
jgi:hypothetical protein